MSVPVFVSPLTVTVARLVPVGGEQTTEVLDTAVKLLHKTIQKLYIYFYTIPPANNEEYLQQVFFKLWVPE